LLKFLIPAVATALVAGCGAKPTASEADSQARYAGLDQAIRAWRADIVKTQAACKGPAEQGCQSFEVACKVEREIAAEEQAKGVSAKVVAGMSWQAWSAAHGEALPAAGFAEFTRTGSTWSRSGPLNGNLTTCETFGAKA
jgi:hypothetical protein